MDLDIGHASYFAHRGKKLNTEEGVINDWLRAIYPKPETEFYSLQICSNGEDPPDGILRTKTGGTVGIEVTELVDEELRTQKIPNKKTHKKAATRRAAKAFHDYTPDKVCLWIEDRVLSKSKNPFKTGCDRAILVIYSDEPSVRTISELRMEPIKQGLFNEAWLLLPPTPNTSGRVAANPFCRALAIPLCV